MIFYVFGHELARFQTLSNSMFRDRSEMFHKRLGWPVVVDDRGWERDEYDVLDTLYVIVSGKYALHECSMRLIPTTRPTMINDHFLKLIGGKKIVHSNTWESTRFCRSDVASRSSTFMLLTATAFLMRRISIEGLVGVFDQSMERLYSRLQIEPSIIGRGLIGSEVVGAGVWSFSNSTFDRLKRLSGLTEYELELSFRYSSLSQKYDQRLA